MTTIAIKIPTERERLAHHLRTRQALNDTEAGKVLGVRREAANRLNASFKKKINSIRAFCAATGNCSLLETLLNN